MLIPAGWSLVSYHFTGESAPRGAVTTIGLHQAAGVMGGTELAQAAHELWDDNMNPVLATTLVLSKTVVRYGPNDTGPTYEYDHEDAGALGNGTAPQVSMLVKKVTALGGRANRGRMYVPGMPASGVHTDGTLTDAYLGALVPAVNDFHDHWSEVFDAPPVLFHSLSSDPTTISALVVESTAATQRRRLRG